MAVELKMDEPYLLYLQGDEAPQVYHQGNRFFDAAGVELDGEVAHEILKNIPDVPPIKSKSKAKEKIKKSKEPVDDFTTSSG